MLGTIGGFLFIIGVLAIFTDFGMALLCMAIGGFLVWCDISTAQDANLRHRNDYGKAPTCYKCGSSRTYFMTYDDKRKSINFWGTASSKIGKRYHCDNCGNEW